jgi:hypothetical protein
MPMHAHVRGRGRGRSAWAWMDACIDELIMDGWVHG